MTIIKKKYLLETQLRSAYDKFPDFSYGHLKLS